MFIYFFFLLKHILSSRLEYKNHTPFETKIAKIDTPFMIKTAEKKTHLLGTHIPISPYKGVAVPGVGAFITSVSFLET